MGNKNIYLLVALVVIIGGFIYWGMIQPDESEPLPTDVIIYYYGETCPYCKDVAKFLDDNKIEEKVDFEKKEVWSNLKNSSEMNRRIKECGISKGDAGVPFLYARGECLIGAPDVISFFKKEAGIE